MQTQRAIVPTELKDLDLVFSLFDSAIGYQKSKGYDVWPQFSRQLIETEIMDCRSWKLVCENTIACVFSVLYNDPEIWKERDAEPSVYLHRIAVNPVFKGKGIMRQVKDWGLQHAREKKRKYLRMDTWGNNETLRSYYISCGFNYIGQQYLENKDGSPVHYGGPVLSLFQIKV